MSNSMHINDISRFTSANNMNFSQKFNLTHFVKDKRAFEFPTNFQASHDGSTMNLFPMKKAEDFNWSVGRTINLFPQISGFNSSVKKRASQEPSASQMTIFYRGQVVVFNDLPSDKAKEVMNLASSLESSLKKRKVETLHSPVSILVPSAKPSINQNPSSNSIPFQPKTKNTAMGAPNFVNNVMPKASALPQASVSNAELPIARKASLQRFLEKRKDRIVSKAPTTANESNGGIKKPWLGLNSLPIFPQKQPQE
ncbi:hypothetical protein RND81_07G073200 [Saponaria officinalis]|uniref:Protein TIFY n=1 Tax=Saponaria officinalis TaxID=3572 RepID=A0AAW1JKX1_SAPOF